MTKADGFQMSAHDFAEEAKGIVLLAFRNGPIENIHAGRTCPECFGKAGFSRITDPEMKTVLKAAVNRVYGLLNLRVSNPEKYEQVLARAIRQTTHWDQPEEQADL